MVNQIKRIMKELNVEQKAKRYDEAIKRAEEYYKEGKTLEYADNLVSGIFPELKESEDERIRKALIKLFKTENFNGYVTLDGIDIEDVLAWLEKQGQTFTKKDVDDAYLKGISDTKNELEKQDEKGTNGNNGEIPFLAWGEEDEENLNWFEKFFRAESVIAGGKDIPQDKYLWFKNLKERVQSQNKWKESLATADLENSLCDMQDGFSDTSYEYRILGEAIEFIRCTEPKPQWKPSDEHMEVLLGEANAWTKGCPKKKVLESLYQDLKKLMEK